MVRLLQTLLYIPIQIAFIPAAIVGMLVGVYKEFVVSPRRDVSYSAGQTLQYRWFMHHLGTRPDPHSVAFTRHFPCESHHGLWAMMGALILSRRWFGFTTKLSTLPEPGEETLDTAAAARVLAFDRIIQKYVDDVDQIVIPGVGFDLIANHFTAGKPVRVFELDQVGTLNIKVETLKEAGIPHDWITYIPVDYARESWSDRLLEAGFDRTKRTLFLWQSVSHFLEADVAMETLRTMAELGADDSVLVLDLYSRAFLSGETSMAARSQANLMRKMGEPWIFGIDMSEDPRVAVEAFLEECGLQMTEYTQFGEKLEIEPYYCIVEAKRSGGASG